MAMEKPWIRYEPRPERLPPEVQQARDAVHEGKLVECTRDEYLATVRAGLQQYAGECIDTSDTLRGWIALEEVKRLDAMHQPFRDTT